MCASFGFVRGPDPNLSASASAKGEVLEMVVAQSSMGVCCSERIEARWGFLPRGKKEATDKRFPRLEVKQEA